MERNCIPLTTSDGTPRAPAFTLKNLRDMVTDLNRLAVKLSAGRRPEAIPVYVLKTGARGYRLVIAQKEGYTEILPWSGKREIGLQIRAYTLGLETRL